MREWTAIPDPNYPPKGIDDGVPEIRLSVLHIPLIK